MTTRQSLRADYAAISLGACSLALILGALGFQYLGGLAPCEMCHWQRWPHIAAAVIGLVGGGFLPRRYGVPVVVGNPDSTEAQALMEMAKNIAGRISTENMRVRLPVMQAQAGGNA